MFYHEIMQAYVLQQKKRNTSFGIQIKLPWQPFSDSLLSSMLSYIAKAYPPTFAVYKLSRSKGLLSEIQA